MKNWGARSSQSRSRNPEQEALFRAETERVRISHKLSDIIGRKTVLKRASSSELVGLCCFHNERSPSMRVNDAKNFYYCFGCSAAGDSLRFIMDSEKLSFMEARAWLGAVDLPAYDPAERAKAAAEDAAERLAAINEAQVVWNSAGPVQGSPAETYLRSRGITMDLPDCLRFTRTYAWRDPETGETGPDKPALLGAVTMGGELVAIQRIFLRPDGSGKASMKRPKKSLGRIIGGALKIPARTYTEFMAGTVILTEGPEDALSIAQDMPDAEVWAALGTAFMPMLTFEPTVRKIVLAGQNDAAGRAAIVKARDALEPQGRPVSVMWPEPQYKDWNDQLRGIAL